MAFSFGRVQVWHENAILDALSDPAVKEILESQ